MTDEDKAQLALGIIPDGFKLQSDEIGGIWIRRHGAWYELPGGGKRTKSGTRAIGEFESYLDELFWAKFKKKEKEE